MARRKAKKPTPEDDEVSMLLATPVPTPGRTHSFVSPALLFIITFTFGAFVMGWFLVQQQQSLDQLSESLTAIQQRVTNFQQVMDRADVQADSDPFVEDRIFSLEQAQKQTWEKAEVFLATERLKNPDLLSKLWELRSEIDTQWDEIQQASLAVTTLHAMFKNQSEEFEVIKQRLAASLSSSSAMPEHVAGLTSAVASVCSRINEQVASVEVLSAQLEGQDSKLSDLKELVYLHNVALHTHTHEMDALLGLFKEKQVMRAQALEEMLGLVQMTLDEQFLASQTLHSSIMAQLQTVHSQLANEPSWPIAHESNVEVVSMTMKNTVEQDTAEQLDVEDGADEEVMLEEQLVEMGEDITEEQEEELTPGVEEEIPGQGEEEEEEDVGDTAEEKETEETITGHALDESLEEELSEEGEARDSAEEESVFVETDEEEQF
ncbi:neurofilament light polypeptide-like [Parambassis ranga]|uniref:Neurofilament light polypeptide-like n=1 Tax=Parambassis ranga TaxID=210632 RepID=A0A6P7IHE5_9TELE|nr:neurofilament light polypeptide-like [Parambassis ranga]